VGIEVVKDENVTPGELEAGSKIIVLMLHPQMILELK
jgi:hypothetical protein